MKEIVKKFNVFKFNELSKKSQETAMSMQREYIYQFRCEELEDYLGTALWEDFNIGGAEISYSLSYCQGDGFCFYNICLLDYFNLKENKTDKLNPFEKWCIDNLSNEYFTILLQYLNDGYNIRVKKDWDIRYEHSYSCLLDEEFYYSDDKEEEEKVNDVIFEIKMKLKDIYHKICKKIEMLGYKYLEDITDEDVMDEINFYQDELDGWFTLDGIRYYE